MRRVIVFGAFDPLHEGHRNFFVQARALGDWLIAVVATDAMIRRLKGREPFLPEQERLLAVETAGVDEVRLGRADGSRYDILQEIDFDVLALGYDQKPTEEEVRVELGRRGKPQVEIVRLAAFQPERYKSSRFRTA